MSAFTEIINELNQENAAARGVIAAAANRNQPAVAGEAATQGANVLLSNIVTHLVGLRDALESAFELLSLDIVGSLDNNFSELVNTISGEGDKNRAQAEKFDEEEEDAAALENLKGSDDEAPTLPGKPGGRWKEFKDKNEDALGMFGMIFAILFKEIIAIYAVAKGMVSMVIAKGKSLFKFLKFGITKLLGPISFLVGAIEAFNNKEGTTLEKTIAGIFGGIGQVIKSFVLWPLDMIKKVVEWGAEQLGFNGVSEWLQSFSFQEMFDKLYVKFQETLTNIGESFTMFIMDTIADPTSILTNLKEFWTSILPDPSETFEKLKGGFTIAKNFMDELLQPLKDMIADKIMELPSVIRWGIPDALKEWVGIDPETGERTAPPPSPAGDGGTPPSPEKTVKKTTTKTKLVGGVVVSKNGEIRDDFSEDEKEKISAARRGLMAMGNEDPFPEFDQINKSEEPSLIKKETLKKQEELQRELDQPGDQQDFFNDVAKKMGFDYAEDVRVVSGVAVRMNGTEVPSELIEYQKSKLKVDPEGNTQFGDHMDDSYRVTYAAPKKEMEVIGTMTGVNQPNASISPAGERVSAGDNLSTAAAKSADLAVSKPSNTTNTVVAPSDNSVRNVSNITSMPLPSPVDQDDLYQAAIGRR